MEQNTNDMMVKAYWDLMQRVRTDPEYARLCSELEAMERQYEAILASLSEEDRLTLDRYITLRENLNRRMLEFACRESVFPFSP